ncbi:uncharacterized protein LOC110707562 isoform X4 [Chenopodium quinoa]|uniref:uncharacterized protein LOC110707562 isoform X4 n=1 Tax=Chenopodium quinoa TaxID=63459 RepID=UPI000B78CFD3|nr:uncharacterized protein LOC110707562 isoform X4 [Chenopodium quinoa]XP_021741276.1 uncharacterized protein LOC110707562 isoform X4 [Chenopodium quinoa]
MDYLSRQKHILFHVVFSRQVFQSVHVMYKMDFLGTSLFVHFRMLVVQAARQEILQTNLSSWSIMDAGCSGSSARIPPYKTVKLEHYGEYQASVSPACVAIPGLNGSVRKNVNTGLNISSAKQNCDELKNYTDSVDLTRSAHVSAETSSFLTNPQKRICELKDYTEQQMVNPTSQSCTIEFDGASKGNPGLSGAGAILRANGGSQVWLLREGVGIATNNVAEYRSVILGLRIALEKGFKHVNVRGDSLLVCNQILGKWKTKNENMANLCKEALQLKKQFQSFTIEQVPREFNSAADSQANRAINLRDGQFEIEMTSRA